MLNTQLTSVASWFKDQTSGDFTGQIRYSSSNKRIESWNGSAWVALDISLTAVAAAAIAAGTVTATFAGNLTGNVTGNVTGSSGTCTAYTAADVLTKIKTVDGTGSGLDADTLDGNQGSYYQPVSGACSYGASSGYSKLTEAGTTSFTVPTGIYKLFVEGYGGAGGGGGGGGSSSTGTNGGTGGSTLVDTLLTIPGGAYGHGGTPTAGGAGGAGGAGNTLGATLPTGAAGTLGYYTSDGQDPPALTNHPGLYASGGWATIHLGDITMGGGGGVASYGINGNGPFPGGGGGGGAGAYYRAFLTVTPGQVLSITIGAGGTAGTNGSAGSGYTSGAAPTAGTCGGLIIWY